MPRNKLRQDQLRNSDAYNDEVPSGPDMEANAQTIQDDLDALRSQFKRGFGLDDWYEEPGAAGGGWIYIEDASVPGGEPGWGDSDAKDWQDDPANTVLQAITCSARDILVRVRASYPLVQLSAPNANVVDAVLPRDAGGIGALYRGDVAITVDVDGNVEAMVKTPDGEDGAVDTLAVTLDLPPTVTQAKFTGPNPAPDPDNYPLGPTGVRQTALKENDTYQVEVTADKPFDQVVFEDFGSGKSVVRTVTPAGSGSQTSVVNLQAANRGTSLQLLAARVKVRDAATLAFSATLDTNHDVDPPGSEVDGFDAVYLRNLFSSGSVTGKTYPVGQAALKGTEATPAPGIQHTAANFDEILYSDPTGIDIDIPNATTFEANKIVTCKDPVGRFNNSATNFRYVMTRHENGAQTTVNSVVVVANVVQQVTIAKPASRLRSGGSNGSAPQNHTITIQSNQPLIEAPVLDEDSGGNRGSFVEGAWGGGPSNWTRTLRVDETVPDEKTPDGGPNFAFENLYTKGLSGLEQTVAVGGSEEYNLGGFVKRPVTFPNFDNDGPIGTAVVLFSKLKSGIITATNQQGLKQPIGTPEPVTDGYTVNAGAQDTIIWLDTVQYTVAQGAQLLDVEEEV